MAADIPSFSKLIPGFDFLQDLAKGAGLGVPGLSGAAGGSAPPAIPGFGQWVAPTLNPEELAKRIEELKTVQFWLDSNAKLLGATIQALEVQRMTLSTLKTMNVQMGDLRDSMMAQVPEALKPKTSNAFSSTATSPSSSKPDGSSDQPADEDSAASDKPAAGLPAVDPMQWWSALTQQFTELASSALKDGTAEAAKRMSSVDLSAFQVPGVGLPDTQDKKPAPKKAEAKPAVKAAPAKRAASGSSHAAATAAASGKSATAGRKNARKTAR